MTARRPRPSYRYARHQAGANVHGRGLDGRVTGPAAAWDARDAAVLAQARQVRAVLGRLTPRR